MKLHDASAVPHLMQQGASAPRACAKFRILKSFQHHLCLRNTPTLYGVESALIAPGYEVQQ